MKNKPQKGRHSRKPPESSHQTRKKREAFPPRKSSSHQTRTHREEEDGPFRRRRAEHHAQEQNSSRSDEVMVVGRKPLIELIRHKRRSISRIFLAEQLHANEEFSRALQNIDREHTVIQTVTEDVLQSHAGDLHHQGVVSFLRGQEAKPLEDLIEHALSTKGNGCLLVLDEIADPHNLGAIFRASDALGVDGIIISKDRSAGVTPTVRKVSAGASEFVPYSIVTNLARALERLKEAGFWLIASDLSPQSEVIGKRDIPQPHALVLGSEGKGIRALTRKLCDFSVQIPMTGHVQSLNVSQAAGILLYELLKARKRL